MVTHLGEKYENTSVTMIVLDHASVKVSFLPKRSRPYDSSLTRSVILPGGKTVALYNLAYPIGVDTLRADMFELYKSPGSSKDVLVGGFCIEGSSHPEPWRYRGKTFKFSAKSSSASGVCSSKIKDYLKANVTLHPEVEIDDLDRTYVYTVYHEVMVAAEEKYPKNTAQSITMKQLREMIAATKGRSNLIFSNRRIALSSEGRPCFV